MKPSEDVVSFASAQTATWTRAEVIARGVRLSYLERQSAVAASAPPILMLHGLVAGGDCFRALAEQLPSAHRVIALDLPGGGFSDRPETGEASFKETARLVAETMLTLGLERPILIGHSYGGAISLQLAASRPDSLRGMVLIAPAHPFSEREDPLVRFYLSFPGRCFAYLLPRVPRRLMFETFRRMPGDRTNVTPEQIETYIQTLRHRGTVAYVLRMLAHWKHDMKALAHLLRRRSPSMPALLLWGELDPVVPASTGAALMRHLPKSQLITLPGVGHLPNDERPEECGAHIRAWLIHLDTH